MNRIAILSSHPIQYYAPLFRLLNERKNIEIKVFYTWSQASKSKYDRDFGREIEWDIPLLDGYENEFVPNISPKPGVYSFFSLINPTLISKIDSFKPDAILVNGWNYWSHLRVMRHFKGRIPVYFRGDSTLLDQKSTYKKWLRNLILKLVYTFTDKAFYVGSNNKAYFLAAGLTEEQLVYAPHAVNNDFFMKDESNLEVRAAQWRKELGINENDFVYLFAGKFEPKKNPVLLIKVFLNLSQQINISTNQNFIESPDHQIHLLLVGNGILENELLQQALGSPFIHFLPFQNQSAMPLMYRIASTYCLPSKGPGETWGLAINEALASGCPVIVSDKVGCAVDLVQQDRNGYIFDHSSEVALITCMNLAFQNRVTFKTNRQFIRDSIKPWSIEECANKMETEFQRL